MIYAALRKAESVVGRPAGSKAWLEDMEARSGLNLAHAKLGRRQHLNRGYCACNPFICARPSPTSRTLLVPAGREIEGVQELDGAMPLHPDVFADVGNMSIGALSAGLRDFGGNDAPAILISERGGDEEWVLSDRLDIRFGQIRTIASRHGLHER